ncbi:hypothetical protein [Rhodopila sp.]|uniref:cupin domain-containing protein n=1 Tax=Rhodopila sp. TaxID=2480087 RepID=UPI003D13299D
MAKASTGIATTKKAKTAADPLPAKKPPARKAKVAVKAATPAASGQTGLRKQAGSKMPTKKAPKKVAALPLPASKGAVSRKAAPSKLTPKRSAPPRVVAKPATRMKPVEKTVAGSKTVNLKKAAPRRAQVKAAVAVPTARRSRPPVTSKRAKPSMPHVKAPQSFTVSHLNETEFKADGLRSYAQYRDLGIAAATAGLCQAHVIRFVPPCTNEVRKPHLHSVDLQLVYVLKGWMKNEFEGIGVQMMSTGSCWLQPSGVRHTVLDYSADCEVLEIIVPADFKTEDVG